VPDVDLAVVLQRLVDQFFEHPVAQVRHHLGTDPAGIVVADERRDILDRPGEGENQHVDGQNLPGHPAVRPHDVELELNRPLHHDLMPFDPVGQVVGLGQTARLVQQLGELRVVVRRVQDFLNRLLLLFAGQPRFVENRRDMLRLYPVGGAAFVRGGIDHADQARNHHQADEQRTADQNAEDDSDRQPEPVGAGVFEKAKVALRFEFAFVAVSASHVCSLGEERGDRIHHGLALFGRGFRIDRQRYDAPGRGFALRVVARFAAEVLKALLEMQRKRVVDRAADADAAQMRDERIAFAVSDFDAVLVVDVTDRITGHLRQRNFPFEIGGGEEFLIFRRVVLARLAPAVEIGQLDRENSRLKRVETEVAADVFVHIGAALAVVAEDFEQLRLFGIVAGHHSAVAEAAEVLAREEREAAVVADRADAAALVLRTDRLAGVFDDDEVVLFGDRHDRVHIGGLAEEVDRNDRLGARRHFFLDLRRIDVVGRRVDVGEDRRRADPDDCADRRKEGEGRGDDFIAGPDPFDHQRDDERVGTAGHADREVAAAVGGDFGFEFLDLGAEDEILRIGDLRNFPKNLFLDRRVLRLQIQQRNRHVDLSLNSVSKFAETPDRELRHRYIFHNIARHPQSFTFFSLFFRNLPGREVYYASKRSTNAGVICGPEPNSNVRSKPVRWAATGWPVWTGK